MPQVDKVTFAPIAFWSFVLYVGGFLSLQSTYFWSLISGVKVAIKGGFKKTVRGLSTGRAFKNLSGFPLISL